MIDLQPYLQQDAITATSYTGISNELLDLFTECQEIFNKHGIPWDYKPNVSGIGLFSTQKIHFFRGYIHDRSVIEPFKEYAQWLISEAEDAKIKVIKRTKKDKLKFELGIFGKLKAKFDKHPLALEHKLTFIAKGNDYFIRGSGKSVRFKVRKATTEKDLELIDTYLDSLINFVILSTKMPSLRLM